MKDDEEYLISYANLKSKLFKNQSDFLNPIDLNKFYNNELLGFPICLPANIKYFGKRDSKLAQNATINVLYDFHDFPILAYLHHVNCHVHNPWGQ